MVSNKIDNTNDTPVHCAPRDAGAGRVFRRTRRARHGMLGPEEQNRPQQWPSQRRCRRADQRLPLCRCYRVTECADILGPARCGGAAGQPCTRTAPVTVSDASNFRVVSRLYSRSCDRTPGVLGDIPLLVLQAPPRGVTRMPAQGSGDKITPPPDTKPVLLIQ